MGTSSPPSPLAASAQGPSRAGAHLFLAALRAARNAFLTTLHPPKESFSILPPAKLESDISYWDDLEAVKREREDEIRTSLGLSKRDADELVKEWLRINGGLGEGSNSP